MAAVLLCSGTKGNVRPGACQGFDSSAFDFGNMFGPASDIQIQAEEMLRVRDNLNQILADHTGQTISKIQVDTDRDFYVCRRLKKYGIVDLVFKKGKNSFH